MVSRCVELMELGFNSANGWGVKVIFMSGGIVWVGVDCISDWGVGSMVVAVGCDGGAGVGGGGLQGASTRPNSSSK